MPITQQVRLHLATAATSGAVAMLQLYGDGSNQVLEAITGRKNWQTGQPRLVHFAGIDEGLAVSWRENWTQLMPHGGPHVVRKIVDKLLELGVVLEAQPPAREVYPEASSELEADMLATIARATSPAAIDALAVQPALWRAFSGSFSSSNLLQQILVRSDILDRLVTPPTVVVVGKPNVGKSTLTNFLLGRSASIVADMPGTTRDWVAGLIELPTLPGAGIVVRWLDTPGVRETEDHIESAAITAAQSVIAHANVVIAMRDPATPWPDANAFSREPNLWVVNKADQLRDNARDSFFDHAAMHICANSGQGVDALRSRVIEALGFASLQNTRELWAFSPRLREIVLRADVDALRKYIALS